MDADAVSAFAPVCEDYDAETDPILTAMGKNPGHTSASWADVYVNQDTRTNIIAFISGWGDGGYPSIFGYDENENIAFEYGTTARQSFCTAHTAIRRVPAGELVFLQDCNTTGMTPAISPQEDSTASLLVT